MIRCAALAALLVVLAVSASAFATSVNGNVMIRQWASSDRCAAAAQRAFPDYTAEANAKRDNAMKQCLANGNLPPRSDLNH
jgi:ABC-type glycerol-3-phosphate transport system substrate-binding protein